MDELDTVTDFIHYLQEKERAIRFGELISIPGEEEFLSYYLNDRASDGYGRFTQEGIRLPGHVEALHEGQWIKFIDSLDYALHRHLKVDGRPWLDLLAGFSDSVLDANVGEGFDVPFLSHERALRALASENRLSRALLARELVDKRASVPGNARSARLVGSVCAPSRLYVFLLFPWNVGEVDYEEYRRERLACMHCYAIVAKYKYVQYREIIVLGIDSKGTGVISETVLAFDTSGDLSAEEKINAQHIMTTMEVLTTTRQISPGSTPSHFGVTRPGRNENCVCGSGKKSKRCCFR
jgi:hypothetical protein